MTIDVEVINLFVKYTVSVWATAYLGRRFLVKLAAFGLVLELVEFTADFHAVSIVLIHLYSIDTKPLRKYHAATL